MLYMELSIKNMSNFEKLFFIGNGIQVIQFLTFEELKKLNNISCITQQCLIKIYLCGFNVNYNMKNEYYGGNILYYPDLEYAYKCFICLYKKDW